MVAYKELIIEMIGKIENERFLKQIYTIILLETRKTK